MTSTPTPTPLLAPPPGVKSNFENPASLLPLANIVAGVCLPIICVFFFARCYVRIFIKRSWIVEDWLTLSGWIGTVAFMGLMLTTMTHHGGQHGWDITAADAKEVAYWFNIVAIEYGVTICIVKVAVLWLYRRVFSPKRWSPFDLTLVILVVIMVGFYLSTSLVKVFACTPREKILNKSLPGSCVNMSLLLNISGLFNTITDFIILLLPIKAVWNLKMKATKKLVVVLVFTFGSCAPIFSLVGFIVRLQISDNPDTTWNQPDIILWGAAELTTGLLCVCFPEMGALFRNRNKHSSGDASFSSSSQNARSNMQSMNHGYVTGYGRYTELEHPKESYGGDSDEIALYNVKVSQYRHSQRQNLPTGVHVQRVFSVESQHAY